MGSRVGRAGGRGTESGGSGAGAVRGQQPAAQCSLHACADPRHAPTHHPPPARPQGAIILGIGGDTSDGGVGAFYEGVMTAGYSSEEADAAVQANIAAVRYGQ